MALGVVLAAAAPATAAPCGSVLDVHAVDRAHVAVVGAAVWIDGRRAGTTDPTGHVVVGGLCDGAREIYVEHARFLPAHAEVALARRATIELQLEVGRSEVIVIEDAAPTSVAMGATSVIEGEALARTRGRAFADALSGVPGVALLRTGTGLARPIVRGQQGRRVALVVDGVRHRAQEWGLDHAPEIDPFVAGRLTVVRGAAGVRHGAEAIGGAVVVEPTPLRRAPGLDGEVLLVGHGNGRGAGVAARLDAAARRWPVAAQVVATLRRQAALTTPTYPLDNTGAVDGTVGAAVGWRAGATELSARYLRYQARLGVCRCLRVDSIADFQAQAALGRPIEADLYRAAFAIERPFQEVAHDLALARVRHHTARGHALVLTYAFQHDLRREYDLVRQAIAGPQFSFRLASHDLLGSVQHRVLHLGPHLHLRGELGASALIQIHRYAGLPLVPDHVAAAGGVHAIERLLLPGVELEVGLRLEHLDRTASLHRRDFLRLVRSDQLAPDACGEGAPDPVPCRSRLTTAAASLGALVAVSAAATLRLELTATSRPPGPDEQYFNGTSPTFPVLGLGKPDLGPERAVGASLTGTLERERVVAEGSLFATRFDDYIDFAPARTPDGQPVFDVLIRGTFPRFAIHPVDATVVGGDGGARWRVGAGVELAAQAAVVRARARGGRPLTFIPPPRVTGSVAYRPPPRWGAREVLLSLEATSVARPAVVDLDADLAPPPPAHVLLGAELGLARDLGGHTIRVAVQARNLLDARYRDYTSLLRYFADQPGRQVVIRIGVTRSARDADASP